MGAMETVDFYAHLAVPADTDALLDAQLAHLGLGRTTAVVDDDTITALIADRPCFGRWKLDEGTNKVRLTHATLPTGFAFNPDLDVEPDHEAFAEITASLAKVAAVVEYTMHVHT
jgi:molybdopterin/thiamine biosynthesis adenylyltransferase